MNLQRRAEQVDPCAVSQKPRQTEAKDKTVKQKKEKNVLIANTTTIITFHFYEHVYVV